MKNPAGYLYKTIRNLTPEQRVVVRKLGLGSLLELKINRLPSRLAFWLVERFDSNTGVLKVFDKEISITPELIRKTLDLPMGYLDVEDTNLWDLATPDPTHKAWKRQYPEGRRVSVANVADMIEKSSGDTGSSFILNFVVLFVSTMSNVSSDGNANASFLPSLVIDHYIMDHLKKGVKNWKEIEEEKKKINQKIFSSVIFANTLLKEPVFPALKFCTSKLLRELDGIMFGIDKFQKKTFKWAPYSDDADDTNYQFVFSAGSDANDEDADADDDNVGSNESVEDADSVEANNFFQREPDIVIDTECDLDTRSPVSASNTLSHGSASNFVASVLKASVETQEPEPDIAINNTECEPAIASVETQEPEPDIAINNTECEPDIASVETQEPEPDIAINNTECEPNIAINKKKGRKGRDGCLDSGFRISKDLPSKRAVTTLGTPEGTTRHGRDVVSPPVVKRSTRQPVAGRVSNDGPIQRPRRDPRKPLKLMDYEDLVVGADEASGRQDSEDDASVVAEFANLSLAGDLLGGKTSAGYNYESVRRWTAKLGYRLDECDKIFVPIHKQIHWCLAVINKKDKKFQYLDSLGGADEKVLGVLAEYIRDEVNDKSGKSIDVTSWEQEFVTDLPSQVNGYDCGMFMIKYIDCYSRDIGLSFSQARKRFGFVRFIGVKNEEMFAKSLASIWIRSFHMYASVARFQRQEQAEAKTKEGIVKALGLVSAKQVVNVECGSSQFKQSYAFVMHRGGGVKNVDTMSNLCRLCREEGLKYVKIHHIGGLWLWLHFQNVESCSAFKNNSTLKSLFTTIKPVSKNFHVDERMVWVEISRLPLCAWGSNAFKKVVTSVGKLMFFEDDHSAAMSLCRVCIATTQMKFIFEMVKVDINGEEYDVHIHKLGSWSINIVDPLSSNSEIDPKVDDDYTNEEESECEGDINGLFEGDKKRKNEKIIQRWNTKERALKVMQHTRSKEKKK
ncbi:ulp1 protease family, C-terminal catalytic domain-containing protein [Tanacetum coccineum]